MFNSKRSRRFVLLFTVLLGLGLTLVVTGALAAAGDDVDPPPPPESNGARGPFFPAEFPSSPLVCPGTITVTGQLDPTSSPTQTGRIFRDGFASTCSGKAYPGILGTGTTYYYESFGAYDNYGSQDACVVVSFDPNIAGGCATNAHAIAYLDSYDPNDQGLNYLGDVGSSVTQPFSFTVPAGGRFLVVVENTQESLPAACSFEFSISDVPCQTSPVIDVSPASLSSTLLLGELFTHTLTISNPALADLNWQILISPTLVEGFTDITALPGQDWALINQSSPLGVTNWFQGNSSVFPAHFGAPHAYIAANFNNASGTGTISNWLLSPELPLNSFSQLDFWTRGPTGSVYPDRLEVRMSTNGSSTDVGADANSVGDFTDLLLTINPSLATGGYPQVWSGYAVTLGDIGAQSGRLAMRYFVTDAGPSGTNSDFIGIDSLGYSLDVPWLSVDPITGTTSSETASTVQVVFDSTGLAAGVYTSTLGIYSNDPVTPEFTVPMTMTVVPTVDLALGKGAAPDPVNTGDTLTYTLSVDNNGLSDATGTTLTDILPPEVSYQSATASQGTCGHSSGTVTCDLGDLGIGGSATVEILVAAPSSPGTISNQASVAALEIDTDSGNNTAAVTSTVQYWMLYLPLVEKE